MKKMIGIETLHMLRSVMEAMLVQAENENWPELAVLDEQRRELLGYPSDQTPVDQVTSIFSNKKVSSRPQHSSGSTTSDSDSSYKQLCDQLLALDKRITESVQSVRLSLVKEKRGLQAQVSAKRNYAQVCSARVKTYG